MFFVVLSYDLSSMLEPFLCSSYISSGSFTHLGVDLLWIIRIVLYIWVSVWDAVQIYMCIGCCYKMYWVSEVC